MQVRVIHSGGALPRSGGRALQRRVREMVGRLAPRLREVRVRLRDVNGPKGGVDQEVAVEAETGHGEQVRALGRGRTRVGAFHRALRRLVTSLLRQIRKRREVQRRSSRRRRSRYGS